jgi:O-antigen ligase
MMLPVTVSESGATYPAEHLSPGLATSRTEHSSLRRIGVARVLSKTIFVSLMSVIILSAIPYGTTHAWWEALFICAIFSLAILWLSEGLLSGVWFKGCSLGLPVVGLALFSFLQTIGRQNGSLATVRFPPWNTISADPYLTRFFALLLLTLTMAGVLLIRYAASERRLRILINVVIGVVVATAIFGLLRQATQYNVGSLLPLARDLGYGQFINKNHFAFLMEMGLGLIIGLVLGGGVKRTHSLIYLAALMPIWTALVLCGSRGGLIAMLAELLTAAVLFSTVVRKEESTKPRSDVSRIIRSTPVRVVLIALLISGVALGTLWLGGDELATKIEATRNEFNSDANGVRLGVSRNEIWRATWKLFVAHPILGVGMGGYWVAIPAVHDASGSMTPQEAHNDYLELLASGGLVGLAFGVWFAILVLKRIRENLAVTHRVRRAACFGAVIGIAGVAVHSLVDFGLHTIVNALVFTTLIVIATSKVQCESDLYGVR